MLWLYNLEKIASLWTSLGASLWTSLFNKASLWTSLGAKLYGYPCMNIPVWTSLCERPCMFKTTCQCWFFIFHQSREFYTVTSQDPFSTKSTFEVLIVHCANCCLLRVPSGNVSHWHLTLMTSRLLGGLSFLRWSIRTYFVVLRICAWNDPWIRHGATTFTEVCPGNVDQCGSFQVNVVPKLMSNAI